MILQLLYNKNNKKIILDENMQIRVQPKETPDAKQD